MSSLPKPFSHADAQLELNRFLRSLEMRSTNDNLTAGTFVAGLRLVGGELANCGRSGANLGAWRLAGFRFL